MACDSFSPLILIPVTRTWARSNNVTVGREAITKYVMVVDNTGNKVEFREREIMVLNDSTVLVVGFNDFMRNVGGTLNTEPARSRYSS